MGLESSCWDFKSFSANANISQQLTPPPSTLSTTHLQKCLQIFTQPASDFHHYARAVYLNSKLDLKASTFQTSEFPHYIIKI